VKQVYKDQLGSSRNLSRTNSPSGSPGAVQVMAAVQLLNLEESMRLANSTKEIEFSVKKTGHDVSSTKRSFACQTFECPTIRPTTNESCGDGNSGHATPILDGIETEKGNIASADLSSTKDQQ
jgi:hypothetical protein